MESNTLCRKNGVFIFLKESCNSWWKYKHLDMNWIRLFPFRVGFWCGLVDWQQIWKSARVHSNWMCLPFDPLAWFSPLPLIGALLGYCSCCSTCLSYAVCHMEGQWSWNNQLTASVAILYFIRKYGTYLNSQTLQMHQQFALIAEEALFNNLLLVPFCR